MTTLGGIGHTLPYLIPNFYYATGVAVVIVAIELTRYLLDPAPLYGHAAFIGHFSGGSRRGSGLSDRHTDRFGVIRK